jgi:molybdate transport system regulatory protein
MHAVGGRCLGCTALAWPVAAIDAAPASCMLLRMTKPAKEKKTSPNIAPEVRFRMRIRQADAIVLGPGKIALLEAVKEHGSISAAARSLGMSYRRAWLLMDELNRSLKSPATVSEHGGQSGGGSLLTPVGEEIVRLYRDIETQAYASCSAQIAKLTKLVAH